MSETGWQPYGRGLPPVSAGKVILADFLQRFLETWDGADWILPSGFDDVSDNGQTLRWAIQSLGQLIMEGNVRSYVRPIGGGDIVGFPPEKWEIDDFLPRFRQCGCNPIAWADPAVEPTHWIFVNEGDVDEFLNSWKDGFPCETDKSSGGPGGLSEDDILRLPAVQTKTGLSKSTIYELIRKDQFPKQLKPTLGRMSGWRSSDIQEWINGAGRLPKIGA